MTMKIYRLIASIILLTLITLPIYAGKGHTIECSSCGYTTDLFFGRGKISIIAATGYCSYCKEFVSVSHKANKIKDAPHAMGTIYHPLINDKRALYPCPTCTRPFLTLDASDFGKTKVLKKLYCPICNEKALQEKSIIMWD